jgi:hypothetical protein
MIGLIALQCDRALVTQHQNTFNSLLSGLCQKRSLPDNHSVISLYLKHNPNVQERDRHLCNDVSTQK